LSDLTGIICFMLIRLRRWPLLAGGAVYSSWVLAFVLPTGLSQRAAFTSELEATGQPYAWLFRVSDVVAGLLLALGAVAALGWAARAPTRCAPLLVLAVAAVAVTGVTNALTGVFALDCTTSNGRCTRLRTAGVPSSWHHHAHLLISNVSGYAFGVTVVALVLVVVFLRSDVTAARASFLPRGLRRALVLGAGLAALTAIPVSSALWPVSWRGFPQRINEAVESLLFVLLGLWAGRAAPVERPPPVSSQRSRS
jgi:hypothetical protein